MKNILILTAASLLSAVLLTLASPGYDIWPLAYVALVPVLLSVPRTGRGFLAGWVFGSAYFMINVHWVITAVSDFGDAPYAVGVMIAIFFAIFLGLFWAVFGYLYQKKRGANLLLAGVIVTLEVIRGSILSGFPMLYLSHTQYSFLPAIQIAEVTGEFGISLLVAYMNISIASLITDKNRQSILLACVLGAAVFAYGFSVQSRDYAGNSLKVNIIQPAYSQSEKWVPDKKYDIMALVNGMLRGAELEKHDMVLLPETVYPAFLSESFAGYQMLSIAGEATPVIAGGIRKTDKKVYHNSVFMFDGDQVSIYDKLRLVPFGEYFPLKTLFKPIDYYFFKGAEDFTPGSATRIFSTEKFAAAPMVCYESMYSALVRDQVMLGADVLTIATNDSWFGNSMGPYQHLAADVMRAVEFRKPVLRAAQSGISAHIKANGQIAETIPLGQKASVTADVTTHKGLTLFATGGYGWLAVFLFAAWYFGRRRAGSGNSY